MVVQVLAEQKTLELSAFEEMLLGKLRSYTKPAKTKHLSYRLGIDKNTLVVALNKLCSNGLIYWHIPKRQDDKQFYGWFVV